LKNTTFAVSKYLLEFHQISCKITKIDNLFANKIIILYLCAANSCIMEILNKIAIEQTVIKHSIAKNALQQWVEVVEQAQWENHNDLKRTFPAADYVGNLRYVFNIKGKGYRIVAVVIFLSGTLTVRFIGTHAEYDKIDASTI
jgi:mRNA interferase HigB